MLGNTNRVGTLLIGFSGMLASGCQQSQVAGEEVRPNIIFILTDDQGWGDVHYNGNQYLETPVMDYLARNSVNFGRFYVSPLSAPTRASFLTGRYHLKTGVSHVSGGREVMRAEEVTIAEALKEAGYATACYGKWHNGEHYPHDPNGQGFDQFFGFSAGHIGSFFNSRLKVNGKEVATKGYITDILTDSSLAFIRQNRNKPFFCYIPYNVPHAPFQVPDNYYDKYKAMGFDNATASVYGMCENLDENLGRILNVLKEENLEKNTILVFSGDNGPNGKYRYNGGMKGYKGQQDEGGVRVPFYVYAPNRFAPREIVNKTGAHIDFFPTMMELCGLEMPGDIQIDGRSLAPLLQDEKVQWPDREIFTHVFYKQLGPAPGSFRNQQYCYVHDLDGPRLYDIMKDPGQKKDLAMLDPHFTDSMKQVYLEWYHDASQGVLEEYYIPLGYKEARRVSLPATMSGFSEGVSFKGKGYTHDWLVNWTGEEELIWWKIDNSSPGFYSVVMEYTCPADETGSLIMVYHKEDTIKTKIQEGFDPLPYEDRDRAPRGGVYEKPWASLPVGKIYIPEGEQEIFLRAEKATGKVVAEVNGITLTKL